MEHHPIRSPASGDAVAEVLRMWLQAFRPHVTGPTWQNLLVLVMGALLAPGKRTVRLRGNSKAEPAHADARIVADDPIPLCRSLQWLDHPVRQPAFREGLCPPHVRASMRSACRTTSLNGAHCQT
jgi:hypothetical protein